MIIINAGCYISTCSIARPGASKSQIRASILKDQEITVARIGEAKSVLWSVDIHLSIQNITLFLLGASKDVMWASGFH